VKIGPVNPEIALLDLKKRKKEITEGKIYSPVGRFAERDKKGVFMILQFLVCGC